MKYVHSKVKYVISGKYLQHAIINRILLSVRLEYTQNTLYDFIQRFFECVGLPYSPLSFPSHPPAGKSDANKIPLWIHQKPA